MENRSLTPICSLSKRSLSPILTYNSASPFKIGIRQPCSSLFFCSGAVVKHFLIHVKLLKAHNDYNAKIFFEVLVVCMCFVRNDFRFAYLAEFLETFRRHSTLFYVIWES